MGRILPDEVSQCQRRDPLRIVLCRADNRLMAIRQRCDLRPLVAAWILAVAALTAACASSGASRPRPFPSPAGSAAAPVVSPSQPDHVAPPPAVPGDQALVATALSFRGTPYRNGGSDPSGFDCSGFTQWVFAQYGVALPRAVEEQFKVGQKISADELKPGDLVFFKTESRGASHVGIFVADDQFVHAPSTRGVIRVEYIHSSYWGRRFVGARRFSLDHEHEPEVAIARPRPFPGQSPRGSRSAD